MQDLDKIFEALSNKHRREMIHLLALQPQSISQLAANRNLSLPAIHKHIKSLESADLILRKKIGKTNFLALNHKSLYVLQNWVTQFHSYWGNNEETLENYQRYLEGGEEE